MTAVGLRTNVRSLVWLLYLLVSSVSAQEGRNLDQFSYGETVTTDSGSPNNIYGPKDWGKVQCSSTDVCVSAFRIRFSWYCVSYSSNSLYTFIHPISLLRLLQLGWEEKYENSQGWELGSTNHCIWCPLEGNSCGAHHSSPINVERNRAIVGHPLYNQCIDSHWLAYYDSSCSYDDLRRTNSFVVDRHSLKVVQPLDKSAAQSDGRYRIDCAGQPNTGRRWGRADFPKGFSQWWLLSHLDFKMPSEHTQEGKRYSAEVQLHHFYSVTSEVAGIDNEVSHGTSFLYTHFILTITNAVLIIHI